MGTKHTPTPWRTAGSGLQIKAKENGYLVAVVEGPNRRARGKEWQEDHDFCHGNAEFIVRACNSYQQMVDALRLIVVASDAGRLEGSDIEACHAALRAAGAA